MSRELEMVDVYSVLSSAASMKEMVKNQRTKI
jgi:hypothetical protein